MVENTKNPRFLVLKRFAKNPFPGRSLEIRTSRLRDPQEGAPWGCLHSFSHTREIRISSDRLGKWIFGFFGNVFKTRNLWICVFSRHFLELSRIIRCCGPWILTVFRLFLSNACLVSKTWLSTGTKAPAENYPTWILFLFECFHRLEKCFSSSHNAIFTMLRIDFAKRSCHPFLLITNPWRTIKVYGNRRAENICQESRDLYPPPPPPDHKKKHRN